MKLRLRSILLGGLAVGALNFSLPAMAQSAPPLVMGYYPNWARYGAGDKFTADKIQQGVGEVVYAFAQFGSCGRSPDAQHPDGYATEADPTFCAKNTNPGMCMSGVQNYKLYSTDNGADYTWAQADKLYPGQNCGYGSGIQTALNRSQAIGAKAVISIGGWSLSAPIRQAIQPANKDVAIKSIVDWLVFSQTGSNKKWDGVDIDWEPNGNQWTLPDASSLNRTVTKQDLVNYLGFLKDLKSALCTEVQKGNLAGCSVKIAMTANPQAIAAADATYGGLYWKSVADVIDTLNMMTYDYKGPFGQRAGICQPPYNVSSNLSNCTGFNAPLYIDPDPKAFDATWSIDGSLKALKNSQVPPGKIGIGIANYGRVFALPTMPTTTSPYLAFQSPQGYSNGSCSTLAGVGGNPAPLDGNNGELTLRSIARGKNQYGTLTGYDFLSPSQYYKPAGGLVSIASGTSTTPNCLVTYDNAATAAEKMSYAVSNQLGGIIVWDLSQDVRQGDTDINGQPIDPSKISTLYGLNNYTKFTQGGGTASARARSPRVR